MILLAIGSNLPGPWGSPCQTLDRAVRELEAQGVRTTRCSHWYRTSPYGGASSGIYVNGALAVESHLPPTALLSVCHRVERAAGRRRGVRWGSRVLDIDLLAYHDVISGPRRFNLNTWRRAGSRRLTLPHPDMANRAFVMVPLAEIAPDWHHPMSGLTARQVLVRLRRTGQGAVLSRVE